MKIATKLLLPFGLLLLLGLISGCSQGTDNKSSNGENSSEVELKYFPKDTITDVNITIDEADFQAILDNPTAEQYYSADVDYNGTVLKNVGIRTKGNSSLSSVARMEDSDRYSFKLSFDEYVTQNLLGITKINLNNNYSDASYMREYLAYEIADSMGIATPLYSFVNVYINGELWGLYTAVEQMSTSFVEREMESMNGALYKSNGGTGADLSSLDTFEQYTGLDLKFGDADEEALLHFTDVLNNEESYEEVLDIDSALNFIALNTVIANMDSYAGNFKHNYYLYELEGKFSIIPWDMNMAFGGFGGSGILIDEPTGVALNTRPLIAQLIANEEYLDRYHQIIEELIANHFTDGAFEQRVQEIKAVISDAVQADPTAFYTFEQFEEGVSSLVTFVDEQIDSINKQLSGEIASSGDGSGSVSSGPGNGGGGFGGGGGRGDGMNFENGNRADGGAGMTPPDGMNFGNADGADGAAGMTPPDGMNFGNTDGADDAAGMTPPDGMNFGNADGVEGAAGMTPPDGMNFGNADGADGAAGMTPPDGMNFGNADGVEGAAGMTPPDGMNFGGGGRGGNFNANQDGQFQFPGMNNQNNAVATVSTEEKEKHAKNTIISIAALLIGCLILLLWRRKRI